MFKGTKLFVGMLGLAGLVLSAVPAQASPIVITFEGLQNNESINSFYNGGTGGSGSSGGPNYGIVFTSDSLALIDEDNGGSGNFANEPSPNTVAYFLTGAGDTMDVAAGFDTGFSFFYTAFGNGSVNVYSGLDGTGTLLASLVLNDSSTPQNGCGGGDPTGSFSCWAPIGVTFAGIAKSVVFSGVANEVAFDNITLGSDIPGGSVPEPTSMVLLGTGLALAGFRRFARK